MTFVAMVVVLPGATPAGVRGRVMGIRTLGIYGLPIGLLLGGWIAGEVGARAITGVPDGTGLTATLAAAIVWPALLRRPPTPRHDSRDKNI